MTSPTNSLRVGSYQFHHYLDGGGRHTTVSLEPHGWLGTSRVTRDKHGGAGRDLQVWRGAGVLGPAPLRRHPPEHPAVRHARERGPPSPPR